MKFRFSRALQIAIFSVSFLAHGQVSWGEDQPVADQGEQGGSKIGNPETTLAISLAAQVYPDRLGGQSIAVFYDRGERSLRVGGLVRARFYVLPYFMPRLDEFASSVKEVCEVSAENPEFANSVVSSMGFHIIPGREAEADLRFEAASREVNNQTVQALITDFSVVGEDEVSISLGQLNPYPFASYHIVAGAQRQTVSEPAVEIYRFPVVPLPFSENTVLARAVSFPTQLSAERALVKASCKVLTDAAAFGDLTAYILTPFDRVSETSVSIVYSTIFGSAGYLDVFNDERQSGSVVATTHSNGAQLNILTSTLGAAVDNANTTTSASDSRHRAVSGDVVHRIAVEFATTVHARVISPDPERGDIFKLSEIEARAERLVNQNSTIIQASIGQNVDGLYELIYKDRVVGTVDASDVLTGNAAPNNDKSSTVEVTSQDGTPYRVTNTGNYSDTRGVSWTHGADGWVPTSVDLTVLSETLVRSTGAYGASSVSAVSGSELQLIVLPKILNSLPQQDEPYRPSTREPIKDVTFYNGQVTTTRLYQYSQTNRSRTTLQELSCNNDLPPLPAGYQVQGLANYDLELFAWVADPGGNINHAVNPGNNGADLFNTNGRFRPNSFDTSIDPSGHCLAIEICSGVPRVGIEAQYQGEICVSEGYRDGCYVNNEWMLWYNSVYPEDRKPTGETERLAEICRKSYLTR